MCPAIPSCFGARSAAQRRKRAAQTHLGARRMHTCVCTRVVARAHAPPHRLPFQTINFQIAASNMVLMSSCAVGGCCTRRRVEHSSTDPSIDRSDNQPSLPYSPAAGMASSSHLHVCLQKGICPCRAEPEPCLPCCDCYQFNYGAACMSTGQTRHAHQPLALLCTIPTQVNKALAHACVCRHMRALLCNLHM